MQLKYNCVADNAHYNAFSLADVTIKSSKLLLGQITQKLEMSHLTYLFKNFSLLQ